MSAYPDSEKTALKERYAHVCSLMENACRKAGRPVSDVRLIAVSKYHPIEAVEAVASFGQQDFGENYIQEMAEKIARRPDLRWHAIGPVQSNKAKELAAFSHSLHCLHSLASDSLAEALNRRLPESAALDVLIQVNIGREPQKSGVLPEELPAFAQRVMKREKLHICGLMCLPPVCEQAEETRPYFAHMRELRDSLSRTLGLPLPQLSMGMSADFPIAIEEGATMVRVGTDIFGARHS